MNLYRCNQKQKRLTAIVNRIVTIQTSLFKVFVLVFGSLVLIFNGVLLIILNYNSKENYCLVYLMFWVSIVIIIKFLCWICFFLFVLVVCLFVCWNYSLRWRTWWIVFRVNKSDLDLFIIHFNIITIIIILQMFIVGFYWTLIFLHMGIS